MNSQDMWNKLQENDLVTGEKPIEGSIHIPWSVRFMQGFAGWLAALFLLGFFASIFSFVFDKDSRGLLIVLGILTSLGAYMLIRSQKSDFFEQLAMAFSLSGQLMVAAGLFFLTFLDMKERLFLLGVYQLALAWIVPQYAHRVLSTSFGLLALLIAMNLSGYHGFGSALIAVFFAFIWLTENNWGKLRKVWEPIGFGVALMIVFSSGFLITGKHLLQEAMRIKTTGWLFAHAELINSLLIALVFLNLVVVMLKEYKVKLDSKTALLSFIVAAMLILISFKIYGISAGLLLLIVGFSRQRKVLMILGGLSILSFVSWYYYNLQATLLFKSITLITMGVGMLLAWLALRHFYGEQSSSELKSIKINKLKKPQILVWLTTAVVLVAINININSKQNLISNGERLLFALAPVGPRSLIQGDYMRIRFDLASIIQTQLQQLNNQSTIPKQKGFVVVEKGDNDVIFFIALYHNQQLQKNQSLIAYKYRNNQIVFTTNAFYFQEGQASHFQQAKFGEFRRSENGEMLLVNMVDKDFQVL